MILYSLQCSQEHVFEAWFRDGATYEAQAAAGEISCPLCADVRITKAPMAPRIARSAEDRAEEQAARVPATAAKAVMDPRMREMARLRAALFAMKKLVQENCDYVGPQFAEEARRIYYGEADERAIYGEATEEEAEALIEEGIPIGRIPWPGDSDA
jgi:hypothetical protein